MNGKVRRKIFDKFGGHCAYCGITIEYKKFQVDHAMPKARISLNLMNESEIIHEDNLYPTCRKCNHYKRDSTIEQFRYTMSTLHERLNKHYINTVAVNFGMMTIKPFSGKFYFETLNQL